MLRTGPTAKPSGHRHGGQPSYSERVLLNPEASRRRAWDDSVLLTATNRSGSFSPHALDRRQSEPQRATTTRRHYDMNNAEPHPRAEQIHQPRPTTVPRQIISAVACLPQSHAPAQGTHVQDFHVQDRRVQDLHSRDYRDQQQQAPRRKTAAAVMVAVGPRDPVLDVLPPQLASASDVSVSMTDRTMRQPAAVQRNTNATTLRRESTSSFSTKQPRALQQRSSSFSTRRASTRGASKTHATRHTARAQSSSAFTRRRSSSSAALHVQYQGDHRGRVHSSSSSARPTSASRPRTSAQRPPTSARKATIASSSSPSTSNETTNQVPQQTQPPLYASGKVPTKSISACVRVAPPTHTSSRDVHVDAASPSTPVRVGAPEYVSPSAARPAVQPRTTAQRPHQRVSMNSNAGQARASTTTVHGNAPPAGDPTLPRPASTQLARNQNTNQNARSLLLPASQSNAAPLNTFGLPPTVLAALASQGQGPAPTQPRAAWASPAQVTATAANATNTTTTHSSATATTAGPSLSFMPDEWRRSAADLVTLMAHAVPHSVVPQLLRPFLAGFLSTGDVMIRSVRDATGWVSTLRLDADRFTAVSVLSFAAQFPYLTDVDLSGTEYDRGILSYLPEIKNIRKLDLTNCQCVDARALAHVAELVHLEELYLEKCELVGVGGIRYVCTLSKLTALNVSGCLKIDNTCLSHMKKLHHLEWLNLAGCVKIDADGFEHLKDSSDLTELNLRGCVNVDNQCLALLSQLSWLQKLHLGFCPLIDAAALGYIGTLMHLKVLDLSGCKLIDLDALGQLKKLRHLQTLDLSFCPNVPRRACLPVNATSILH